MDTPTKKQASVTALKQYQSERKRINERNSAFMGEWKDELSRQIKRHSLDQTSEHEKKTETENEENLTDRKKAEEKRGEERHEKKEGDEDKEAKESISRNMNNWDSQKRKNRMGMPLPLTP